MKKLIVFLILAIICLLCLLQTGVFTKKDEIDEIFEENAPTILTEQDMPRSKLIRSFKVVKLGNSYKRTLGIKGIDYKKLKWKTVTMYYENWVAYKEENAGISIQIIRTHLDSSNEAARELIKLDGLENALKPGSLTGKPIGDVCWSAFGPTKSKKPVHAYALHFVKGKAIVRLQVVMDNHDPDFVENLARIIESRM